MVFAVFQGAVFAENEEYTPDDRWLWSGCDPMDVSAANLVIDMFLMYQNSDSDEDPLNNFKDSGLLDDDEIREMLLSLARGDDPLNWIIMGDVNADNEVTASDARETLLMAVGFYDFRTKDSAYFMAADIDKDNVITAADARIILRASVGLEEL
ncbi:MAG: hypothetical protein J1E34_04340 [Oscillospiraceae bacterium]|nr:hypothetical protein [Oscillospiraceae bacterium]